MIIEITGSPGTGKSTLVSKYCRQPEQEATLFSDDLVLEHFKLSSVTIRHRYLRKLMADVILVLIFLFHLNRYRQFLLYVGNALRRAGESHYVKINVIRNVLLKIARFEFIRKRLKDRTVIVDEGLSHIPFNLVDYADDEYVAEMRKRLESALAMIERQLKSINVIVIVRHQSDVYDAVAKRGHKRIGLKSPYTMDRFNKYNSLLSEEYINLSGNYFMSKTVYTLGNNSAFQDNFRYMINRMVSR